MKVMGNSTRARVAAQILGHRVDGFDGAAAVREEPLRIPHQIDLDGSEIAVLHADAVRDDVEVRAIVLDFGNRAILQNVFDGQRRLNQKSR